MGGFKIVDTTKGKLITFEGGEGAGKSTQVALLAAYLEAQGIQVLKTREPGGSAGAEEIRRILVEGSVDKWDAITETLLIIAARRSHFIELLGPALSDGKWIVCDRFSDSTLAYQGYGQGMDLAVVRELQSMAIGEFTPDLTFLLDIPVDEGLMRAGARGAAARYEQMGADFHCRIRDGFLEMANAESDRIVVIDGQLSAEVVEAQIRNHIKRHFDLS